MGWVREETGLSSFLVHSPITMKTRLCKILQSWFLQSHSFSVPAKRWFGDELPVPSPIPQNAFSF